MEASQLTSLAGTSPRRGRNALVGPVHNVFLLDVTAAIGRCGSGWCVVTAVPGSTCRA
jgi:hypothetical protein